MCHEVRREGIGSICWSQRSSSDEAEGFVMELAIEREEIIKKYLLGDLPEQARTEVEIGILKERDYFHELLLVEGELTDDLVVGALTDHEQHRVSQYVLAVPELRQRLSLIRLIALISKSEAEDAPDNRWEETLREAQKNRELILSLMDSDWSGLQLLMLLESMPQSKTELSAKLNVDETVITATLSNLMQSGAIEENESLFLCTERGAESLQKVQALLKPKIANGA
jgi:winged helix-turn-helix protein